MAQTKKQHRRKKVGRRTARVLKRRSSGPLSDLTNGNLRQGVMPVSLDPLEKVDNYIQALIVDCVLTTEANV